LFCDIAFAFIGFVEQADENVGIDKSAFIHFVSREFATARARAASIK